jgi:hypothetical protein
MADTYADVCADGTQVTSVVGGGTPGVSFGATLRALPEDGMFVRAVSAFSKQFAVVKGHDTDTTYLIDSAGTIQNLGANFGNTAQCVNATATSIVVVWVDTSSTYKTQFFNPTTLASLGAATTAAIPTPPTSIGILDIDTSGTPTWTHLNRSITVQGVPLLNPVRRSTWWIGQTAPPLADSIVAVQQTTGRKGTLYNALAFEPHAALADNGTGNIYVAFRILGGTAGFVTFSQSTLPAWEGGTVVGSGTSGANPALAELTGLYKQPVTDRNDLMTRPWYALILKLAALATAPVDVTNAVGTLSPNNGGVLNPPNTGSIPVPGSDGEVLHVDTGVMAASPDFVWDLTLQLLKLIGASGGAININPWDTDHADVTFGAYINALSQYIPVNTTAGFLFHDQTLDEHGIDTWSGLTPGVAVPFTSGRGVYIGGPAHGSFPWSVQAGQYGGLGTGAIPGMTIGAFRNTSGNGAASTAFFQERDGTIWYVWFDTTGTLRKHSARPTENNSVSDTAGTAIGTGDVTGPAGVTADGNVAVYNGTTGKIIKDGGTPSAFVSGAGYWSPLTNGDTVNPELVFSLADTISVWTPL